MSTHTSEWRGLHTLVTGGGGFVGSHLVDQLLELGAHVRVLDRLETLGERNLEHVKNRIDLHKADVRDDGAVDAAVADCDFVFHLAGNSSVPRSIEHRNLDFTTNAVGTFNVADSIVRHRTPRVLFASSAAVYGPPTYVPVNEAHPLAPVSPYGATKLAGEMMLSAYARAYDFEVTIVRLFNAYGPRQRQHVIFDLISKLVRDSQRLEILGSGDQQRDYCYISDVVAGLLAAARSASSPAKVVNIAGGDPISIRNLAELILRTLGLTETQLVFGQPSWKGDIDVFSADIGVAKSLGWSPVTKLQDGIRRMAASLGLIA